MNVAAVAFPFVVLRHEGEGLAKIVGNHFGAGFVDGVVITGAQHIVVEEGDFLLPVIALALHPFAVHSRCIHLVSDFTQQWLDPGGGEQIVIDVVVG